VIAATPNDFMYGTNGGVGRQFKFVS